MSATLAIWIAAALSGGAALAYEICWSRALVVPLGNSMDAAALVLAGFMLGIGAGARIAGGWAERVGSALRLYALLELLLGLYALVAPGLLARLSGLSAAAGALDSPGLATALRYGAALLLITLPCLAMGATLPLLVRALTTSHTKLRAQIGIVYGANTLGAALGAFATGFWGIAELGLWRCGAVAAGGSLVAAVLAMAASRGRVERPAAVRRQARRRRPGRGVRRLALGAALVSGLAMLACEMLWARVLTFVFGHDTYAFASLLAIVLLGLALGGLGHRLLAHRDQRRVLGVLLGLSAVAVLASFGGAAALIVQAGRDPFGLIGAENLATSVWLELYRELAFTPLLVLVPSILAGALFPTACSLYGGEAVDPGRQVGMVGLVNGLGSALGALLAAFVLVDLAGIQISFVLLALLLGATSSVAFAVRGRDDWRRETAALAAAPLAVTIVIALALPPNLPRQMLLRSVGERHQTLLYYEEARTGTVSVIENRINGERQLLMNAVNEVTTRLVHDQSFKVLGHLGPLLHREPKTAIMICLGAGLSASAAVTHPLERLDVVDLSAAVARGARYFDQQNHGVLDDPLLHLHIDDGRQFLLNSEAQYDVAIIDSTHPKAVDSWILYTREFYELLHSRLRDGGIAVQWLPLHGLSEREFKIVVRTFHSAFPEMTLWANAGFETYGQVAYAKMLGTKGAPLSIDVPRLERRLARPRVQQDLAPYGVSTVPELLDLFLGTALDVERWTQDLPVQTDDHPIVPYTTAFSGGRPMTPPLLLAVRSSVSPLLAGLALGSGTRAAIEEAAKAQGLVLAGQLEQAAKRRPEGAKIRLYQQQARTSRGYYVALAQIYQADADRLFEAGTQLANLGHPEQAQAAFEQALGVRPKDFPSQLNLALLWADRGEIDRALARLGRLRSERPRSAMVHYNLGTLVLDSGDPGAAVTHLQAARAAAPDSVGAALALGRAYLALGDLDRAEQQLTELSGRNRWVAEAHNLLGLVASERGEHEGAALQHERARTLQPYRPAYSYNLGLALRRAEATAAAEQAFRAALELDVEHTRALNELGQLYSAQKRFDRAADLHLQALEIDPDDAAAAHHLGVALRGQGRTHEAIGAFCLALQIQPELSASRRQLAELDATMADCR